MIHSNISVLENGHIAFSNTDVVELANKFGTPLYLSDEKRIRENCKTYRNTVAKYFGSESIPLYASKALCCKEIYRIVSQEGLGTDVVSGGELYTALSVGFPSEKIYFHGNNKTEEEIIYGLNSNIGAFVVDNFEELAFINEQAGKMNKVQNILFHTNYFCHNITWKNIPRKRQPARKPYVVISKPNFKICANRIGKLQIFKIHFI